MPRSLMPCGQPKLSSMPSAPASWVFLVISCQASRCRLDHERHKKRPIGIRLLDPRDFLEVDLERPIGDQFNIIEPHHLAAVVIDGAVARRDVDDRLVRQRLPDRPAPAGVEGAANLIFGVGRRAGRQPERDWVPSRRRIRSTGRSCGLLAGRGSEACAALSCHERATCEFRVPRSCRPARRRRLRRPCADSRRRRRARRYWSPRWLDRPRFCRRRTSSSGKAATRSRSGSWPSALTTMSAAITKFEPGRVLTRTLCENRAWSSSVRKNSTPRAVPPSPTTRTGWANHSKRTPSDRARSYS